MKRREVLTAAALLCAVAVQDAGARAQRAELNGAASYFEFGTVVALRQKSVDIQTFDEQKQRPVQHSFALSRESRADVVHVGDTVEVIFTAGGAGAEWTIRRLVSLAAGIPRAGLPPAAAGSASRPAAAESAQARPAVVQPRGVKLPSRPSGSLDAHGRPANPAAVALPTASSARAGGGTVSIDLGNRAEARLPPVTAVPLGDPNADPRLHSPAARTIARDTPSEACQRSSEEWPKLPITLAVLDFRYPTEREESHEVGTTGGGSGTAVADLVYSRLEADNEFLMSRADRRRLDRSDFAGAARIGRQLGVDAVLAGTFVPVAPPPGTVVDPDFPPPVKAYELRAGIVDTCTGQLLMRLDSVRCPEGVLASSSAGSVCQRFSVTTKQAADPRDAARAFQVPLDALLAPLEHPVAPDRDADTVGDVVNADGESVTLKLRSASGVRAGDQLAVRASRLAKEPTAYTLHRLQNEEVGRVTIASVTGTLATGHFAGQYPVKTGDVVEAIPPQ